MINTQRLLATLAVFTTLGLCTQLFAQDAGQATTLMISPENAFAIMAGNAEKGDASAMFNLGTFYEQGIGVPRNYSKALEWYQKSADHGLAEGYYNLGVCYEIGMGDKADPQKSAENYHKSADLGFAQGMFIMANLYGTGFGVQQSDTNSLELLEKAAQTGHSSAMNAIGVVFTNGSLGQGQDEKKALEWFQRAADAGSLEAVKNIAVIYRNGLGVKADPFTALVWYNIAKNGGYIASDLDAIIEELKTNMKPADITKAETDSTKWLNDFRARQAK